MKTKHNWKYTIPITRAEETEEGIFLEGEASGPERDTHGTRMSPEAIQDFARQIADRVESGNPLPYVDQHLKFGVTRELGAVVSGAVNEANHHLRVRVQLDDINPNARFIHEKIQRGKKYGMSIAGGGVDYEWEFDEDGNKTPLFTHVELEEISHTPQPSWVPSFGTVLARSIEEDGQGETMSDTLDAAPVTETPATETEQETPVASENVELSEETTEEAVVTEETTEEAEVERARIAQADKDAVLTAFGDLALKLKNLGIDPASALVTEETTTEATENTTVENSENGDDASLTVERQDALVTLIKDEIQRETKPLVDQVKKQADYIEQLEKMPAGKLPAPILREKFESDNDIKLDDMEPDARMKYALEKIYAAKS